ncbi:PIN domain-containing protein [Pasteurella sp. PK-2025]|uniref:PIN domain-containing protein n=1 Tax=Pasteurella sp. PK-2025 TaxID=3413133 RepID=UPI003C72BD28
MKYAFIDYENIHSLDNIRLNEYEKVYLFLGAQQQSISLSEKFNDQIEICLVTVKEVAKNNLDFHLVFFLGKLDQELDKKISFHVISKDKGYQGVCDYITHQQHARTCQLIAVENGHTENKTETAKNPIVANQPPKPEVQQPKPAAPQSKPAAPQSKPAVPQSKPPVVATPNPSASIDAEKVQKYFSAYQQFIAKVENRHLPRTTEKLFNHIRSQSDLKSQSVASVTPLVRAVIAKLQQENILTISNNKIDYCHTPSNTERYCAYLFNKGKKNRPAKLASLKNDIRSQLNLRNDSKAVEDILASLKSRGVFREVQDGSIEYLTHH